MSGLEWGSVDMATSFCSTWSGLYLGAGVMCIWIWTSLDPVTMHCIQVICVCLVLLGFPNTIVLLVLNGLYNWEHAMPGRYSWCNRIPQRNKNSKNDHNNYNTNLKSQCSKHNINQTLYYFIFDFILSINFFKLPVDITVVSFFIQESLHWRYPGRTCTMMRWLQL